MANVYVEPRPKGRPEGSPIEDYVVEDHADHGLATFKTQREAIDWAKGEGHTPHVARVRHLNDKKKADHWRAALDRNTERNKKPTVHLGHALRIIYFSARCALAAPRCSQDCGP